MGFMVWLRVNFSACPLATILTSCVSGVVFHCSSAIFSYLWQITCIPIHQLPRSWVWKNWSRTSSPACWLYCVWLFTAQYVLLTSRTEGCILSYSAACTGVLLRASKNQWRCGRSAIQLVSACLIRLFLNKGENIQYVTRHRYICKLHNHIRGHLIPGGVSPPLESHSALRDQWLGGHSGWGVTHLWQATSYFALSSACMPFLCLFASRIPIWFHV